MEYVSKKMGTFQLREEVNSGLNKAYAKNLTLNQLSNFRKLYAYEDRITLYWSDVPNCRKNYLDSVDNIIHCYPSSVDENVNVFKTIVGLQADIYTGTHCWFSRDTWFNSVHNCPTCIGSSRCFTGGDPNGTKWARVWLR